MMRHLSHIFFVDAETFTGSCLGWRWRGGGHRYGTEVPPGSRPSTPATESAAADITDVVLTRENEPAAGSLWRLYL